MHHGKIARPTIDPLGAPIHMIIHKVLECCFDIMNAVLAAEGFIKHTRIILVLGFT